MLFESQGKTEEIEARKVIAKSYKRLLFTFEMQCPYVQFVHQRNHD